MYNTFRNEPSVYDERTQLYRNFYASKRIICPSLEQYLPKFDIFFRILCFKVLLEVVNTNLEAIENTIRSCFLLRKVYTGCAMIYAKQNLMVQDGSKLNGVSTDKTEMWKEHYIRNKEPLRNAIIGKPI